MASMVLACLFDRVDGSYNDDGGVGLVAISWCLLTRRPRRAEPHAPRPSGVSQLQPDTSHGRPHRAASFLQDCEVRLFLRRHCAMGRRDVGTRRCAVTVKAERGVRFRVRGLLCTKPYLVCSKDTRVRSTTRGRLLFDPLAVFAPIIFSGFGRGRLIYSLVLFFTNGTKLCAVNTILVLRFLACPARSHRCCCFLLWCLLFILAQGGARLWSCLF